MDVKTLLINLLEIFNYPVFLQGSMSDEESYPESFFTFWNNDTSSDSFYDNKENSYSWDFDVNFYSSDPTLTNSKLLEARELLIKNGFIIDGKGYDLVSDEPTHTGRGMNVLYIER